MSAVTISQPDITLLLDLQGVIRGATLADGLPTAGLDLWVGRPWMETVGEGDNVRRILQDAAANGVSAYRMVNQRFPSGLELPVEYSTIRLGGEAGLIAIGRNQTTVTELQNRLIAAQQAREQDYWKLREVETRYRLLFDTSSEVVLVVRPEGAAAGFRVVEANLAALRALSLTPGQDLLPELPPAEHEAFRVMLERVRSQGRAPGVVVHLGVGRQAWTMRASLVASEPGQNEPGQVIMLQLSPLGGAVRAQIASTLSSPSLPIDTLLERLPDSFVVVDQDGVILGANAAFLDLVQAGAPGGVIGHGLGRWLSRPGADITVLLATVHRHRLVRMFATTLQTSFSDDIEVEISAAGNLDGAGAGATGTTGAGASAPRQIVGLLIRDISRRRASAPVVLHPGSPDGDNASAHASGKTLLAALGTMADGLGQTSLPTLIKETVSLVERHYIEEALARADGNRTATAEMLGLSRQSLYMKLNRYGLDTESMAASETTAAMAGTGDDT